ncbi:MAG: IgGFc-binding protein, partial [Myxococcales bacterium]|nr:IgGFc-binding protein [Myxococcales bacterium]
NYMVAAWPVWGGSYPSFYTVVAKEDGTTVNLSPSNTGKTIYAGGGVNANGTGQVMLNASDALIVIAQANDVTGTIVNAD